MGCKLAENEPLKNLRKSLGIPNQCHSLREHCVMSRSRLEGDHTMGIPGAVIGYCQALFNYAGEAHLHTQQVQRSLKSIDAPWHNSHELFWGFRKSTETPQSYVESGMQPLHGSGRVPILITGLDAIGDLATINSILDTSPNVFPNETILLRIVISSKDSAKSASAIIKRLLKESQSKSEMPKWWPLLQGNVSAEIWSDLKRDLGEAWSFTNVAVNPFVEKDVYEVVQEQVTVGQVAVGLSDGIFDDGHIQLAEGMVRLPGAPEIQSYNLFEFTELLRPLETVPTLIVLGPSLPDWTEEMNCSRIASLLPILKRGCSNLWDGIDEKTKNTVWGLAA